MLASHHLDPDHALQAAAASVVLQLGLWVHSFQMHLYLQTSSGLARAQLCRGWLAWISLSAAAHCLDLIGDNLQKVWHSRLLIN